MCDGLRSAWACAQIPAWGNRSARAEFACQAGKHVRHCVRCSRASGAHAPVSSSRLAAHEAVRDVESALLPGGRSVADLALRAGMTTDEIECIEECGTEATIPLLRRLAAALDADVRLTPGHDLGSVGFETHAA